MWVSNLPSAVSPIIPVRPHPRWVPRTQKLISLYLWIQTVAGWPLLVVNNCPRLSFFRWWIVRALFCSNLAIEVELRLIVRYKMVSMRSEKAHMCSTPSLGRFRYTASKTVSIFVWLTMTLSRPFKEDRLTLRLSMPLCSRRSMVWCPWLCACS